MVDTENNKTTNHESLETGRFLVSLVIGLFIFEELISIFAGDFSILRILLGSLLFYLVYEGYHWARILVGALAACGSILGIVTLFLLIQPEPSWALLLAIFSITVSSAVMMSILFFSTSAIAFLERRKQEPKEPEKIIEERPRLLPQYHELSEKIRSRLDIELPTYEISTVLSIKNKEDKIVMMKYIAAFRNVFRCNPDGSVVWQAELPTSSGDVYTNVEWKDEYLTAFSRSLIAVHLDVETGKILPAKDV